MISSIPILMRQRSKDQINELLTLESMIPCKPEDKFIRQKVLERFLNIGQSEAKRVKEGNKARLMMKKKIEDGLLKQEDNTDPFRQLIIRAILANQNWGNIIANNKWGKLFVKNHEVWSLYEQWLIFLCFQGFQKDKAKFLSSNIIKRSNKIMMLQTYGFKTTYYYNKYKKWISKDINSLKMIHYEIERNLLISIKLGESFYQTAERLNLEEILNSSLNPLENDRNDWILFLCTKFEDNYPMKKPDFDFVKQTFTWIQHKINVRHKVNDFQKKLSLILNQYTNFQEYFTNEIEASLLSDIKQKNSWKIAQKHISQLQLFLMNSTFQKKQTIDFSKNNGSKIQQSNDENQNSINFIKNQSSSLYKQENWHSNDKYSLNSKDNSQSIRLISSIPILLFERTKDKTRQLSIMASLIEYKTDEQKNIKQKFLERVLNCDKSNKFKGSKQQYKSHLKILKEQIFDRKTPLEEISDPIQQFLTKAIVQNESWGDLIAINKWANVFHINHTTWSLYDQWIIFLCFQGFDKEKAIFLASSLTKRTRSIIRHLSGFKTSYYLRKYKKWISKDVSQLELIHYEVERNLLISIKLGQNIYETAQCLNLEEILQSVANPIQNQRNDWLLFLCTQFEDNYPIKKPQFNKQIQQIQWSEIQINVRYKVAQYQQKLKSILGRYTNFFLFFTNEIQASLLSDIKQKNSWKLAQTHIEELFHYNNVIKYQKNLKTQRIQDTNEEDFPQTISLKNSAPVNVKEENYPISDKQAISSFPNNDKLKQIQHKADVSPQISSKINMPPQQKNSHYFEKCSFAKQPQIGFNTNKISDRLVLPTNKCQIFSGIKKCKQSVQSLNQKFVQTNLQTLPKNGLQNRKMVQPIYQSLLKKYQQNPEMIKKMDSQKIKTFLEHTLSSNLKNTDHLIFGDAIQEQSEEESMDDYDDSNQKDLSQSFVIGFDELVTRVKSKEASNKNKLK